MMTTIELDAGPKTGLEAFKRDSGAVTGDAQVGGSVGGEVFGVMWRRL